MAHPTAEAKVLNFIRESLFPNLPSWLDRLIEGDLGEVESSVEGMMTKLSNLLLGHLLPAAAQCLVSQQQQSRSNVAQRPLTVRLRSGCQVRVPSLYDKRPDEHDDQPRHLLVRHWALIGGASPGRYDAMAYAAVSLPSYDLAQCLLERHGVGSCVFGVRDLTNKLADRMHRGGEVNFLLGPEESLAGKRVVISSDGGRTLTRQYNGRVSDKNYACFDAKWREPKLFVIDVLDEHGKQCRKHLPIYGCRFSDDDHLLLLRQYLERLSVQEAAEVQIIADGATWIWNKIPPMLVELNVDAARTTQTLDYYHAVQHLEALFKTLPTRIGKRQRSRWWKRCKQWLYQGCSRGIVRLFSGLYQRFPPEMKTELNYFIKHRKRMYYADYEQGNLLCGSGIVESSVRRVINLRYKNTSTFWNQDTVEKLYGLRGAALSKRWDIMMKNLTNQSSSMGQE